MALEVETKIKLENPEKTKEDIIKLGAVHIKKEKQTDEFFDFDDQRIKNSNELIRIRNKKTLCLKENQRESENIKQSDEYESEIENYDTIIRVFKKVNLKVTGKKERTRDKYKLRNCEICIDTLPFGNFIEIEGPRTEIITISKRLGFNENQLISKTYCKLFEEHCEKNNIPKTNFMVFKKEAK